MAESVFNTATLPTLQGWQAPGSLDFQAAFLRAGGWALPRTDAFPDAAKLRARLEELKKSMREGAKIGLDLRGLRDSADSVMAAAREAGVAFLLHTAELPPSLAVLRHANMPRLVAVQNPEEGARAKAGGAAALLARACDVASLRFLGLPVMAMADTEAEAKQAMADGAIGLQPRTPSMLDASPLAANLVAAPRVAVRPDMAEFSHAVVSAARPVSEGWPGNRKAFISLVWKAIRSARPEWELSEIVFKSMLAEAHRSGHVVLAGADLKDKCNLKELEDSKILYKNTVWHFVRVED